MQAETLMKTLVLFSSRPITVHIAHNDIAIVKHMEETVLKFGLGDWLRYKECLSKCQNPIESHLRLDSVSIEYPSGLQDMINGWKICATARLFLQVEILCLVILIPRARKMHF